MTRMTKVSSPNRAAKPGIPPEIHQHLKALKSARSENVRVTATVTASEALNKIREEVTRSQAPITIASAKKICATLRRLALPTLRTPNRRLQYDAKTIQALTELLISLSKASLKDSVEPQAGRPKDQRKRKRTMLALSCLNTLIAICERAEQDLSWRACLEYARSAAEFADTDPNDLFNRANINNLSTILAEKLSSAFRDLLSRADIGEAASLFELVRTNKLLRQKIAEDLTELLRRESAVWPASSQEWIVTTLGLQRDTREVSYANPADAPEIRQAASLLLFLWDNAAEKSATREAFDRFRTLCEKHFRLYLKGEPGQLVKYDSRLHEGSEPASGDVRLTRPWVEFVDPPRSSVVIRALVATS